MEIVQTRITVLGETMEKKNRNACAEQMKGMQTETAEGERQYGGKRGEKHAPIDQKGNEDPILSFIRENYWEIYSKQIK